MKSPLLIVGWSVRAAAESALRGGFDAYTIDAFLDADLTEAAVWSRGFADWREVAAIAESLPPSDWMYCGGVENHPDVVAAVSNRHRLLGTSPEALRRVRDPFELARFAAGRDWAMPAMRREAEGSDVVSVAPWLVKRFASAGGVGVRRYHRGQAVPPGTYLQEFVAGEVWGVSYLAADDGCRLLGVCEQLRDDAALPTSFRYGGSIGPIAPASSTVEKLQRVGAAIAAEFELRGLFGIDVVAAPSGSLYLLEVNPRYTASMELLERALGRSLVELHVQSCRDESVGEIAVASESTMFGKRIVYCEESGAMVDDDTACRLRAWSKSDRRPSVADVPTAGSRFAPGDPLATVLATGVDRQAVCDALTAGERRLRSLLVGRS